MFHQYGKLVFIDLETTGPDPLNDRITEIGLVEVSEHGVRRWSALVNPLVPIPPFITQLTGISNDMVRDAPTFDLLQDDLLRRLEGGLFIAHNARFDYGFLRNEFKRLGKTFRCDVLCTVKLSRKLFPHEIRHSLDALIERHGLSADARHRALADAELIWQFWGLLEEAVPEDTLLGTIRHLLQRPNLPVHLDANLLDDIPDTPGVYIFYGKDDVPLYVHRAAHLRQRVLSHFHADQPSNKDVKLAREAHRVEWHEAAGDIGAQLLEARLMRKLQPAGNQSKPDEHQICSWRVVNGRQAVLAWANEEGFGRGEPLHGLFTSRLKAEATLRALAGEGTHTLASLPMINWPYAGPVALLETGDDGREAMQVIDNWCWLGTAGAEHELRQLVEESPARRAFEFDTYRIVSRAIESGKARVRAL